MKIKAFVNILVETEAYDTPEAIEDAVLAVLENEEDLKVIWHRSSEAKDKGK